MTAELVDGRSSLDDVVGELDLPFSGAALAVALRDLAREERFEPPSPRGGLSVVDENYLDQHSGIRVDGSAIERALSRTIAQAAAVRANALTTAEVADLLGVDGSRVRHMVAEGSLTALTRGGRSSLYPTWQLAGGAVLPGLRAVLKGVPGGLSAVSLARFMTLPSAELLVDGSAVTPREWLLSGRAVAAVLEQVSSMDGPF